MVSEDCNRIEPKLDTTFCKSFNFKLLASITRRFFFFFKTFKASFSIPFPITTSKNNLFNSIANFLLILKLHETIPPNALIGSQSKASL